MLIAETIARIRREHFIKGKTIKEIARDLKVSHGSEGAEVGRDLLRVRAAGAAAAKARTMGRAAQPRR
jgi:predicted signal transduction protein with EAL and GGDEF domain